MAVAHSAPGEQRKSRLAEEEFSERAGDNHELDAYELQAVLNTFSHGRQIETGNLCFKAHFL